jgi:hypothetical protein
MGVTLTEFLVVQITADETDLSTSRLGDPDEHWWLPAAVTIERLEAECEAKRRIVDLHAIDCWVGTGPDGDDEYFCTGCSTRSASYPDEVLCPTLAALATVYADRPGYRDEWRNA